MEGRVERDAEAAEAAAIIDREVDAYFRDRAARRAGPAVAALRARFEAERRKVLDEIGGEDAEQATRLLLNRLLHAPSVALRRLAQQGEIDDAEAARLLDELFGTTGSDNGNGKGGPEETE